MSFVDDDGIRNTIHSVLVCASYDKSVLLQYAATLNAAEAVRRKIFPANTINEQFKVQPVRFIDA